MDIKFSNELVTVLRYARDEAMRTGSYGIGVDHFTLAVIRHGHNGAYRTLTGCGIDTGTLKELVDKAVFRENSIPFCDMERVRPTKAGEQVVTAAGMEMLRTGSNRVTTSHLLLAISRSEGNATSDYLRSIPLGHDALEDYMSKNGFLIPESGRVSTDLRTIAGALGEQLSHLYTDSISQTNTLS